QRRRHPLVGSYRRNAGNAYFLIQTGRRRGSLRSTRCMMAWAPQYCLGTSIGIPLLLNARDVLHIHCREETVRAVFSYCPGCSQSPVSIRGADGTNRGEGKLLPVGQHDDPLLLHPPTFLDGAMRPIITPTTQHTATVPIDHEPARLKRRCRSLGI